VEPNAATMLVLVELTTAKGMPSNVTVGLPLPKLCPLMLI
jgi:hypothetical protein